LDVQGGGALNLCRCMSDSQDDPASAVSAALAEQMQHLIHRFHEERRKLEERTFRADDENDED